LIGRPETKVHFLVVGFPNLSWAYELYMYVKSMYPIYCIYG
jgi:hypothetical protein